MQGLEKFKEYFSGYEENHILIGGSRNIHLGGFVQEDMVRFIEAIRNDVLNENITGVKNMTTEYYVKRLKEIFNGNGLCKKTQNRTGTKKLSGDDAVSGKGMSLKAKIGNLARKRDMSAQVVL